MFGVFVGLTATGCGLNQPYPEKGLYAFDVGDPPRAAAASPRVLRVAGVRVASPYDARSFVYRTGSDQFETDYYHGFVTDPHDLFTGELIRWLSDGGIYATVVGPANSADDDVQLEMNVTACFGDLSARGEPSAAIDARCFLLEDADAQTRVVLKKAYRSRVPLSGKDPEDMAAGLGQAYRKLLGELTADLMEFETSRGSK